MTRYGYHYRIDRAPVMGIRAMSHVNVEKAKSFGEQILKQMTGKMVKDHTFKMKEQVLTMDIGCTLKEEQPLRNV